MKQSERLQRERYNELTASQIEFPFRVAVCAWCRPKELGAGLGAVSHGICPRHLRKMRQTLERARSGSRSSRR
jgi:hypothetical protein